MKHSKVENTDNRQIRQNRQKWGGELSVPQFGGSSVTAKTAEDIRRLQTLTTVKFAEAIRCQTTVGNRQNRRRISLTTVKTAEAFPPPPTVKTAEGTTAKTAVVDWWWWGGGWYFDPRSESHSVRGTRLIGVTKKIIFSGKCVLLCPKFCKHGDDPTPWATPAYCQRLLKLW